MDKKRLLFLQLLLFSTCIHSIMFVALFFLHHGAGYDCAIEISQQLLHANNAKIVFLPFYKKLDSKVLAKLSAPSKGKHAKSLLKQVDAEKSAVVAAKKSAAVAAENKKKPLKRTTLVADSGVAKKKGKKNKSADAAPKKKTQGVKKEQPKQESIKEEKKEQAPKLTEEPKKPEEIKEEVESESAHSAAADQPAANSDVGGLPETIALDLSSDEQVVYVGQAEYEALQMQEYFKQELVTHWRPPVGVPKDCVCELLVLVDWNGLIKNLILQKSSGVLIYDMAARSAVVAMELPSWAQGKEFLITFKQ